MQGLTDVALYILLSALALAAFGFVAVWVCSFRRPTPPPPPVISREDAVYAHAWGLTLTGWLALTDQARANKRRDVTHAPNFQTGPQ